jgi:hypothetical protein
MLAISSNIELVLPLLVVDSALVAGWSLASGLACLTFHSGFMVCVYVEPT